MENGGERLEVRRAMESGGERTAMENGRPEASRAMENGGGTMRRMPAKEWVMCSTCSGFMSRIERTTKPAVVEVVTEAEKMRNLMKAVLLHGPLQEIEPAEATEEQWKVLKRRRRIMVETKKCPTCSGSLLEACPTSSRVEGSDLMSVLLSRGGGKERKKIATEDEAMVADARSEQTLQKLLKRPREEGKAMVADARSEQTLQKLLKRSREEGMRSSSGLKKAKSKDKEGSGSTKKKAKRSSEMEGSGSKEAKMKGSGLKEDATIEDIIKSDRIDRKTKIEIWRVLKKSLQILNEYPVQSQSKEEAKTEDSESDVGNRKPKMVTKRLDKEYIDNLKNQPPPRRPRIPNTHYMKQPIIDMIAAYDEVDRVFFEYLQCHSTIKGYAEVQLEVTDDEGDDHKLV